MLETTRQLCFGFEPKSHGPIDSAALDVSRHVPLCQNRHLRPLLEIILALRAWKVPLLTPVLVGVPEAGILPPKPAIWAGPRVPGVSFLSPDPPLPQVILMVRFQVCVEWHSGNPALDRNLASNAVHSFCSLLMVRAGGCGDPSLEVTGVPPASSAELSVQ